MKKLSCAIPGIFEYQETIIPEWVPGYTLLKIKQIGVCGTDIHAFEGTQPFFNYPRILGHELAADIVKTSPNNGFTIGETVTVIPYFHCGMCIACRSGKTNCCTDIKVCGVHIDGAMQEYFLVPDCSLIHGKGLNYDELSLVEPLAIGAHGVRRAGIVPGEFALIIGAGPIGLGAMEFARIAGAEVIALDVNEKRLLFGREKLGVKYSINALDSNVQDQIEEITKGDMPIVVIDCTGNLNAINNAFKYMAHGARYVLIGLQKDNITFNHPEFHKREGTLMSSRNATMEDFMHVISCMKEKKVNPLNYITHRIPFEYVSKEFTNISDPKNGVIKAMITM